MGEARALIQSFIGKGAAEGAEATGMASTGADATATQAPAGGNVDTSAVTKETENTVKKQKRPALKVIQGGAKGIVQSTPTPAELPTPGGIGLLLLIILFLLFAVTKTSQGNTRLQLIWATITGNASFGTSGAQSGDISPATQLATGSPYGAIPGAAIGVDPTNGGGIGSQWGGGFY